MSLYFVHPKLTIGDYPIANDFFKYCFQELEEHVEVINVRSDQVLSSVRSSRNDAVAFFNINSDQEYNTNLLVLLKEAVKENSEIYPIAITAEKRTPPDIVKHKQSFDVVDELRRRCLTDANLSTISIALARTIISCLQPTLSKDRMHLFISHRRLDGEEVTAAFCRELRSRAESVFRDLIDIRVGEDAQEIIETNLKKSDAVIFLDTPKAGESDWIAIELQTALSLNLPIVWVRIGSQAGRAGLKIIPAGTPHFEFDLAPMQDNIDPKLVDEVIHKAFKISREYSKCVFDQLRRLKSITEKNGFIFEELDRRNMIYKVHIPRYGFRYFQRPMTHIVQCFGRFPKDSDREQLNPNVNKLGFEPHPVHGPYYDTSLLLAPIPEQESKGSDESNCVIDSFDEYIYSIENYLRPSGKDKKGVIISGAFPDCEPEYQQHLTDAVYAFTQTVFDRSGIVIFGGHPTFQHLIFDLGQRLRPKDYLEAIHLYLSKYFVADASIAEYQKSATVIATESIDQDREKSLSLMRETMIKDEQALCLIAMGGKTKAGGHLPGVDEEIELAKSCGLPVFIIGSVGGRTAEIAFDLNSQGWKNKPNDLTVQENEELMVSIDFRVLASKILDNIGL